MLFKVVKVVNFVLGGIRIQIVNVVQGEPVSRFFVHLFFPTLSEYSLFLFSTIAYSTVRQYKFFIQFVIRDGLLYRNVMAGSKLDQREKQIKNPLKFRLNPPPLPNTFVMICAKPLSFGVVYCLT